LLPQEALKYYNQTTKQKEMLQFALNYLQTDDEVRNTGPALRESSLSLGRTGVGCFVAVGVGWLARRPFCFSPAACGMWLGSVVHTL